MIARTTEPTFLLTTWPEHDNCGYTRTIDILLHEIFATRSFRDFEVSIFRHSLISRFCILTHFNLVFFSETHSISLSMLFNMSLNLIKQLNQQCPIKQKDVPSVYMARFVVHGWIQVMFLVVNWLQKGSKWLLQTCAMVIDLFLNYWHDVSHALD